MKYNKKTRIALLAISSLLVVAGCRDNTTVQQDSGAQTVQEQAVESPEENTPPMDNPNGSVDETQTVELVMVGDILLHDPVEAAAKKEDGTYDFHFLFAEIQDEIAAADVALVNQEVIIGGEELGVSGYPAFNAPYEIADTLQDAGFDVICHGTNHALDKGGAGIRNTIQYWNTNYPEMVICGIHGSAEDQNTLRIIEKNGIRIAVLNYTYGTNGIDLPADMPYAVDYLEESRVAADLEAAEAAADITIVCPHWGIEYQLEPSAEQQRWAEFMVEHGADVIIGTHPHVIQSIQEEDGVPIFYSLGNCLNWTSDSGSGIANRMVGGMARIKIEKQADGSTTVADYGVEALVSHVTPGPEGVTVWPLQDYTETLAQENAIRNQDSAFSMEYCQNLCDTVWGEGNWE